MTKKNKKYWVESVPIKKFIDFCFVRGITKLTTVLTKQFYCFGYDHQKGLSLKTAWSYFIKFIHTDFGNRMVGKES